MPYKLNIRILPVGEAGLGLDAVLKVVVKGREEVDAGKALYLVNGTDGLAHGLTGADVLVDEADGGGMFASAENNLVECLRNSDATTALTSDGLVAIAAKDGTTDNIDTLVATSPGATELLQVVPVVLVQIVVLRTDVGHEESLLLGRTVPLVVACRTHVATIVARLHIVEGGDRIRYVAVWRKSKILTLTLAVGMVLGEIPADSQRDTQGFGIPRLVGIALQWGDILTEPDIGEIVL